MHRITAILFAVLLTPGCFSDAGSGSSSTTNETDTDETSTGSSGTTGDGSTSSADTGSSEDTGSSGDTGSMDMGVTPDVGDDPVELPDPLVWYDFNGNGDDQVGDAHASEIWKLPLTYVDGYDGLAAEIGPDTGHFGASQTFGMDFTALAEESAFSMSFRIQPTAYQASHILWQMGNTGESFNTNSFIVRFTSGYIEVLTETEEGTNNVALLGQVPSIDEWHNLVFVFDGTQASLYMDGVLEGSEEYVLVDTDAWGINIAAGTDHGAPFEGLLDDIQVYDEVLSPEQAELLSTL